MICWFALDHFCSLGFGPPVGVFHDIVVSSVIWYLDLFIMFSHWIMFLTHSLLSLD